MKDHSVRNSEPVTLTSRAGSPCEVPDEFLCPITLSPMQRPMVTRSGLNFERSAILQWLQTSPSCPLTRTPLRLKDLIPDSGLEAKIQTWLKTNDIPNLHEDDDEEEHGQEGGDGGMTFVLIVPETADEPKKKTKRHGSRRGAAAASSSVRRFRDRRSRDSDSSTPRTLAARSG